MMFKTHLIFSVLIGLVLVNHIQVNKYLSIFLVIIGSSLPDIDNPKSKIGRRLPLVSDVVNIFSSHRGIFHSLFPVIGLMIIFIVYNQIYLFALSIGYLSHLFLDSLTKTGINYFHPFQLFTVKGVVKTGSFFEFIIFICLTTITAIYIF